jgi:hypothetical protein
VNGEYRMSWWKKLFGKNTAAVESAQTGDLYEAAAFESEDRVIQAMAGKPALSKLLELLPPPLVPELARNLAKDRDFGPDPLTEYSLEFPASQSFDPNSLLAAITKELRASFGSPSLYVRLPTGQVIHSPFRTPAATSWIVGWSLRDDIVSVDSLRLHAVALQNWLATRPEGFSNAPLDVEKAALQEPHIFA